MAAAALSQTRACDPGTRTRARARAARARRALAKAAAALSQSHVRHGQRPGRCPLSGKAMQRSTWTPNRHQSCALLFLFLVGGEISSRVIWRACVPQVCRSGVYPPGWERLKGVGGQISSEGFGLPAHPSLSRDAIRNSLT